MTEVCMSLGAREVRFPDAFGPADAPNRQRHRGDVTPARVRPSRDRFRRVRPVAGKKPRAASSDSEGLGATRAVHRQARNVSLE